MPAAKKTVRTEPLLSPAGVGAAPLESGMLPSVPTAVNVASELPAPTNRDIEPSEDASPLTADELAFLKGEGKYAENQTAVTPPRPSIGRIVHYVLTAGDAEAVNKARAASVRAVRGVPQLDGHAVGEGQHVAAIVVAVHSETCVSLQVFLPGNDQLFQSSVQAGVHYGEPGTWHWPERE